MKRSHILYSIILLCIIGLTTGSCSRVILNGDPLAKYKRVIVELNDGTVVKGINATLYADSLIFNKNQSYQLSQIKSLKYSDTHRGGPSAVIGFIGGLGGLGVTLIIMNNLDDNKKDDSECIAFSCPYEFDYRLLYIGLPAVLLGPILGFKIGSNYYINWQKYDSSRFQEIKQAMTLKTQNKTFRVGYKFPLR